MQAAPAHVYEFGNFRLDTAKRVLRQLDGTTVPLTPRVFETLLYMVEHHDTVLDKERLMEAVWPDSIVEENNLSQNISTLRRIFGETPGSHSYIVTVPGRGYRFVAEVSDRTDNGSTAVKAEQRTGPTLAEIRTEAATATDRQQSPGKTGGPFALAVLGIVVLAGAFLARGPSVHWPEKHKIAKAPPAPSSGTMTDIVRSIAVLPFENLSGNPENAYFTDGIQEEILMRLAKIADLKVVSRTSTVRYKRSPENLREIATQLGVANVLEGSVQRTADRVHVNVQLIKAASDMHLWAEAYDRKLTDIFAVESEIAKTIADTLQAKLTGSERNAIAAQPTENTEAYQLYLKGRFHWNKRKADHLLQAVDYFNKAIEKDPGYALAYAGLASTYAILPEYSGLPAKDYIPKTDAAAKKAIDLDPTLAEPHAALGMIKYANQWDWAGAEIELKRAIELNPNYPTSHHWYSICLRQQGKFEEGLSEIKRAQELDPLSPIINLNVAEALYIMQRDDQAIEQYQKTLELDPNFPGVHLNLAVAYAQQRKFDEAIRELEKVRQIVGSENPYGLGLLGYVFATAGKKEDAKRILHQLLDLSRQGYTLSAEIAVVYAGLNDYDKAFEWLGKGYDEQNTGLGYLKIGHVWDNLHSDPRYTAFLKKIGLQK